MRLSILAILLLLATPALAQPVAVEVNPNGNNVSAAAKPEQKGIPLNGLWRSDSALIEAEKLSAEKKYSAALSVLDQILARNPRNSDAYVDQSLAWLNLGHVDKAKSSVENALLVDPKHMGAYVVSGLIAIMQKDQPLAENYLSALRMVCRGETCPEFQTLQRILRETKPTE